MVSFYFRSDLDPYQNETGSATLIIILTEGYPLQQEIPRMHLEGAESWQPEVKEDVDSDTLDLNNPVFKSSLWYPLKIKSVKVKNI